MLFLATSCSAVEYRAFDLGSLGGGYAEARAISNDGRVAGLSSDLVDGRAFVWEQSSGMTNLYSFSGQQISQAYGVNTDGRVVGAAWAGARYHAFVWDAADGMRDLGVLSGGFSYAYAINDLGQVVGTSDGQAFIWAEGAGMVPLNALSTGGSEAAHAINNSGVAAGQASNSDGIHAVLWDSTGGVQSIGRLSPEDRYSYAQGINDLGQVVGYSGHSLPAPACGETDQAFVWSAATGMRGLGVLPGYLTSYAYDINNHGRVVGYAWGTHVAAFVYDEVSGMQALPNLPGMAVSYAYAINDSGWIVGYSQPMIGSGEAHAVLWKPVPEPSSLLALGSGLVALGGLVRRRRR